MVAELWKELVFIQIFSPKMSLLIMSSTKRESLISLQIWMTFLSFFLPFWLLMLGHLALCWKSKLIKDLSHFWIDFCVGCKNVAQFQYFACCCPSMPCQLLALACDPQRDQDFHISWVHSGHEEGMVAGCLNLRSFFFSLSFIYLFKQSLQLTWYSNSQSWDQE